MSPTQTAKTIERACTELTRGGHQVTFTAIAAATGISRSTLYRNTGLRALIDHHKNAANGPLPAISEELTTLRAAVDTLASQVRSHEEQLRRLRN